MNLSQKEWAEKLDKDDNAVVIDVRTPEEWAEGIIPNSLLIDIHGGPKFLESVNALDYSKNYYVYCKAGGRSAQACSIMNQLGFQNAYNLMGGFSQWQGERVFPE
jgi:rhodanese-related sulfurtransferase